jgi:hypothetical protein
MNLRHTVAGILEAKDDIDVHVEGYGTLKLSTLRRMVSRDIDKMSSDVLKGKMSNVLHVIESGVFRNKIKAIQAGEEALSK